MADKKSTMSRDQNEIYIKNKKKNTKGAFTPRDTFFIASLVLFWIVVNPMWTIYI